MEENRYYPCVVGGTCIYLEKCLQHKCCIIVHYILLLSNQHQLHHNCYVAVIK
jgi:hypothetical protein